MRISILAFVLLAACGSDSGSKIDAAMGVDGQTPDGGGSGSATLSCADYCSTITSACTGANQQYATATDCMNTCMHFPMGMLGDTTGNTLGCHSYHAGAAMTDAATHCIHAGPSGGGACGASCEDFCSLVTAICPTEYPNANTCMTQCGQYATTPPYTSGETMGNTFACRMYHATAASTNPTLHCPHTAKNSNVCK